MSTSPPLILTVPTLPPLLFIRMIVQWRQVRWALLFVWFTPAPASMMYVPDARVTLPLMSIVVLKHFIPVGLAIEIVSLGWFDGNAVQPVGVGSGTEPNGSASWTVNGWSTVPV